MDFVQRFEFFRIWISVHQCSQPITHWGKSCCGIEFLQRFLTNIAKQKIQLQLETFLKMNQIIVVAGENVERIILIKVTRPKNMRKTFDLLTIIRKLNHPMIKQVIPRPRNISTLWHVSVSLLHKCYYGSKYFLQSFSWDLDIRDMMEVEALETKLNSPKLVLIVEFDDR